jgi:hypothetical protein
LRNTGTKKKLNSALYVLGAYVSINGRKAALQYALNVKLDAQIESWKG